MIDWIQDIVVRQWHDLLARPSGPMSFRFLLQPAVAIFLALRDGLKDARTGRSPYFWTILHDPSRRSARLREGLKATSHVLLLGAVMDAAYQFIAYKAFYPVEMLIVVFGLAFVPYLLARGPADRVARWWLERHIDSDIHAPKK